MPRFCFGLSKTANCFCLPSKADKERRVDDEHVLVQLETTSTNTFALVPCASIKQKDATSCRDSPSVEILCPPPTLKPCLAQAQQESNQLSEGFNQEEHKKVDWVSGGRKETITINWKVKDFPALCELKELLRNETLVFSAGHAINAPTRWCFNLQKMKNENNIGLFLKRLKPLSLEEDSDDFENRNRNTSNNLLVVNPQVPPVRNPSSATDDDDNDLDDLVYIHYECIIRRSGYGDIWLHKRTCIPNFEIGQRLGFRKLFTMDDLREADNQPSASTKAVPLLSTENTLNLEIKFNLHLRSSGKTKSEINLLESMSQENDERFHSHLLGAELGFLLESGNNSDLILVMEEDDKTFAVHKSILTARSAVFAAMLHSGMKESRTGVVRIKDITSKAMESLLSYAYTGNVNIEMNWGDVRQVQDLIYAADKYSLKGLKDLCDHSMFKGCTKDNAMELLYLAQTHGLNVAVKKISMFIKRNVDDVLCPNLKRS